MLFFVHHTKSAKINFCVDFGSYYSKSGYSVSNEAPTIAINYQSKRLTPTFISFRAPAEFNTSSNRVVTVKEAKSLIPEFGERAISYMQLHPYSATGFFPYFTDMNDTTIKQSASKLFVNSSASRVTIGDSAITFLNMYLNCVINGRGVSDLWFIVPASWTIPQREVLSNQVTAAGFQKPIMIDDVDAVISAYSIERSTKGKKRVLFVDVGATSIEAYRVLFDLDEDKMPYTVRESFAIDTDNGGAFLTAEIAKEIKKQGYIKNDRLSFDVAEKAKCDLTLLESVTVSIDDDHNFTLTRQELEVIGKDLKSSIERVVSEALGKVKVDEVQVIGGSSRVIFVQETILKLTGCSSIGHALNADEALVIGGLRYNQFTSDISKYQTYKKGHVTSIYTVELEVNGTHYLACKKGEKCSTTMPIDGQIENITMKYNEQEIRQGLKTKEVVYWKPKYNESVDLVFHTDPFQLGHPLFKNGTKAYLGLFKVPFQHTKAYKAILKTIKNRAKMERAHNKLEQSVIDIIHEIETNTTIWLFSSEEERKHIVEEALSIKKWLFDEAPFVQNDKPFTEKYDCLKKAIQPVHRRINSNSTTYSAIEWYDQLIRASHYALEVGWPVKPKNGSPERIEKFAKMLDESENWITGIKRIIMATPPWVDRPKNTSESKIMKNGKPLYDEYYAILGKKPDELNSDIERENIHNEL